MSGVDVGGPPPSDGDTAVSPGFLSGVLEALADPVAVICAETGAFVYTNTAWTNALGYAPGALTGRHVSSVNAPSDRVPQEIAAEMLAVLDRGEVWRGEVELRRHDGVTVWWEQTVSRHDDKHGRPAWLVVGRDATTRRASATALRESERRLRAAFEALPVAAALADEDGRVLAVNDALVQLARARREELLGRSLEAVLAPVDLDAVRELAAAGRRGDVAHYRYAARCVGLRRVGVTAAIVRHVDGRFLAAAVLVEPDQSSSSTS